MEKRSAYALLAISVLAGLFALAAADCGDDCNNNGICAGDSCLCYPGYSGTYCEDSDGNYTITADFVDVTGNDSIAADPIPTPPPPVSYCPDTTPVKCANGDCKATIDACNTCTATQVYCKATGVCKSSIDKCPLPACADSAPYYCAGKGCQAKPSDCLDTPTSGEDVTCQGAVQCWDSSCALNLGLCPPISSCKGTASVRCADGTCAATTSACDNTLLSEACPTGQTRCITGQCAATCPPYDGCPAEAPFECNDKTCKATAAACSSGCNSGLTKCLDGTCKKSCGAVNTKVLTKPLPVSYKASSSGGLSLVAPGGASLGTIEKPSALTLSDDIEIAPAADSELRDVYTGDVAGAAFSRVRSPAVKFSVGAADTVSQDITYSLSCSDEDRLDQMCLGVISGSAGDKYWTCADTTLERSGTTCVGVSRKTGVHAIINNPEKDYEKKCTSGATAAAKTACRSCCQTACIASMTKVKGSTVYTYCTNACRTTCDAAA
eukprot:CAMPEP_0113886872 /NCGR_PEP_ID=MMETSP0780_2-20120614/11835_1 /TAXON_ID=652834 /ORGANISM="Palpitomonas bilix" /LENGTH=493 /DNA_ID=CAMNT_0000875213 /DNA_START=128 /DNA_END=1609 /DNA_ORIENTATION=+ /assembly_acc=CAM_ASM_000599